MSLVSCGEDTNCVDPEQVDRHDGMGGTYLHIFICMPVRSLPDYAAAYHW